jgi:hypothetical protein
MKQNVAVLEIVIDGVAHVIVGPKLPAVFTRSVYVATDLDNMLQVCSGEPGIVL